MLPSQPTVADQEKLKESYVDPRVKRTRQLLINAFVEVSKEKDFASITVQDITERATVNRATFYAHFEDKYALMNYYVRDTFGKKIKNGMEPNCNFTQHNLRSLIITTCEYLAETREGCSASSSHLEPQLRTQIQELLYTLLLRWIGSLPLRPGRRPIAPELIAGTLSWTVFGAAIQWVMEGKKRSAEEVASQVVDLMMGGLAQFVDLSGAVSS